MEQRIGANSKPLEGAGFDPAFIPGLTSPAPAEPEDAAPEDAEAKATEADEVEEAGPEAIEKAAGPEAEVVEAEVEDTADDGEEEASEGPVFEAADRRARIVADATGVRLALDEEKCEFRWDEIGAVETEAPRFGKRFTITVHTPDRRWYPIEIEATARSRFKEWEEELDAVLDAYFDDGADASDDTDTDAGTDADTDAGEGREEARA
ncbi:hypothetical protein [Streptomyces sp. NPDC101234]|uniref:hypothetical protein n=1 Tax=Streptomyces sp. NPDC101234 TaxID=3366138 RepID=UPI0037F23A9E